MRYRSGFKPLNSDFSGTQFESNDWLLVYVIKPRDHWANTHERAVVMQKNIRWYFPLLSCEMWMFVRKTLQLLRDLFCEQQKSCIFSKAKDFIFNDWTYINKKLFYRQNKVDAGLIKPGNAFIKTEWHTFYE